MRDGRLGKSDLYFDVRGTETCMITGWTLLQDLEDPAASGVADGVQCAIEGFVGFSHGQIEID